MGNIADDFGLSDKADPYWRKYIISLFGTSLIRRFSGLDNIERYQDKKDGDIYIELDTDDRQWRRISIEKKTRDAEKYYQRFRNDRSIMVEIEGNAELSKRGSSWLDCDADLLAYGWFYKSEPERGIIEPVVWETRPLQNWLKINYPNYPKIYSTTIFNGKTRYHTRNALIPVLDMSRYEFDVSLIRPRDKEKSPQGRLDDF